MADLTARLLAQETFEEAVAELYLFAKDSQLLVEVARTLHRQLATAKAEGAAEALEWIYAGKGSSIEFDPEYLLRRAAALRKQVQR